MNTIFAATSLSTLWLSAQQFVLRLLAALVVFLIGWALIKYLLRLVQRILTKKKFDEGLHPFILSIVKITLIVLLALICASIININITPVITALGAVGLAVSLAIKDSLANLAGGVFILITKPFVSGNFVEIGSATGTVREIGLLHCILDTPDHKEIFYPNGDISKAVITNYSSAPERRVDLSFTIPYSANWERAQEIICRVAEAHDKVLRTPEPPMARILSYEDSAVVLTSRTWVNSADYWPVYFDLTEQIRTALDEAGMPAPFPHLDLRVDRTSISV